jgi:hypothetical protein
MKEQKIRDFNLIKGFLMKLNFLNRYFVKTKRSNNLLFIAPTEVMSKCVVRELSDGEFFVSEFDIDNDYN